MKSLLISVILFVALIVCIFLNVWYIRQSSDYITETIQKLNTTDIIDVNNMDENRSDRLAELENFWEENKNRIGLSVSFRELDHFEELLVELRWAYENRDEDEFQKYCALLLDAIEEITRTEKLSIENIF